jgi:hypothetical protein
MSPVANTFVLVGPKQKRARTSFRTNNDTGNKGI